MPLPGGLAVPVGGLVEVPFDTTFARFVSLGQAELACLVSLPGRFPDLFDGVSMQGWDCSNCKQDKQKCCEQFSHSRFSTVARIERSEIRGDVGNFPGFRCALSGLRHYGTDVWRYLFCMAR